MNLHALGLTLPPALLTMATYNGTLAAVRALGRSGVPVTTADSKRWAMSAWSKHTTARERCPDAREGSRLLAWLLQFGRTHRKHALIATSDDTAWLFARHRDELSQHFFVPSASEHAVYQLLNKRLLYAHAEAVGLRAPRTWFPSSADGLAQVVETATFPVIVKPRTQVLFKRQAKGTIVSAPNDLDSIYLGFGNSPYGDESRELDGGATRPMVQEYFPSAATGIYTISAFVHRGRLHGACASRKLLQQPRKVGVGVCFEEAPLELDVVSGLEQLVGRVGYSGVIEAEFVTNDEGVFLIDFNPRFYNQMAFEVARGLPLPVLAYLDALGDEDALQEACDELPRSAAPSGRIFVDLFTFRTMLAAQRLSGALGAEDHRRWNEWYRHHRGMRTYAAFDRSDLVPFGLSFVHQASAHAKHPRKFVRSTLLNRC